MKFSLLFVVFLSSCEVSKAYKILFAFPIPSKSHLIVVQGLSTYLAQKGHNVTVVSPFPLSKPIENYRDIVIPMRDVDWFKSEMEKSQTNMLEKISQTMKLLLGMADSMFENPEFKRALEEEEFDLVFIGFFMSEFLLGLGDHFKCPTMMISANAAWTPINQLFGNPTGVTSVPSIALHFPQGMNFIARVKNFISIVFEHMYCMVNAYLQRDIYNKHFPSDRYIPYDEAIKNISMVLLNTHFSQGIVRPYVPAMVEVGGLQIKPIPDPLPKDLQDWLDGAEHGAIFFSFGTNAKSTFLPKEKVEMLLKVFAQLKQRVIMKWESDTLEGKPENVLISEWLPQDDVLAHKNVVLFISQCGLGSVVESKYHGVPIVGIPLFGDQDANSRLVVTEGWGVTVDFASLSEDSLQDAINEVLENPQYTETARRISKLYKDRPMNARETAAYWLEYVIRHRGAPHLQYNAVHLNVWQKMSLDVIAALLAAFYVTLKVFSFSIKKVWSKFGKAKEPSKNKKIN